MLIGEMYSEVGNRQSDMTNIKFPTLERLFRLYTEHGATNPVLLKLNCCECGNDFDLELHKTSQGYGINGGIIFVTKANRLIAKCMDCH